MTKIRAEEIPSYEIDGETLALWKDFAWCWLVGTIIWSFIFWGINSAIVNYAAFPSTVLAFMILAFNDGTQFLVYRMVPADWQDAATEVTRHT